MNPDARARPAALVTTPMVVTVLLLASTPLWLKSVGLYQDRKSVV